MESAFGIDHGEVSKGFKAFSAFKSAKKKPATPKPAYEYENPFNKPSTGGKGLSAKQFSAANGNRDNRSLSQLTDARQRPNNKGMSTTSSARGNFLNAGQKRPNY